MPAQFATFFLGNDYFGIDVLLVREINQNMVVTEVDPSPVYIVGLMNLRGQIVTVADLKVKLGIEDKAGVSGENCIVLKTDEELDRLRDKGFGVSKTAKDIVGLMVDRIGDMVTVHEDEMESAPANVNGVDSRYIRGIVKLDGKLLVVLNVQTVLAMENCNQTADCYKV